MPIGQDGCGEDDYLEIISPQSPGGLLGPGNSKFCGLNTDQHIYIDVRQEIASFGRNDVLFYVVPEIVKFRNFLGILKGYFNHIKKDILTFIQEKDFQFNGL